MVPHLLLPKFSMKPVIQILQLLRDVAAEVHAHRASRNDRCRRAWHSLSKAARDPKVLDEKLCTLVRRWAELAKLSLHRPPLPETLRRVFRQDPDPEHWLREFCKLQGYFDTDPWTGMDVLAHPMPIRQVTPHVLRLGAISAMVVVLCLQVAFIGLARLHQLDLWDTLRYVFISMLFLVLAVYFSDGGNAHRKASRIARWF